MSHALVTGSKSQSPLARRDCYERRRIFCIYSFRLLLTYVTLFAGSNRPSGAAAGGDTSPGMIGATGSRHQTAGRRRSSVALSTGGQATPPNSLLGVPSRLPQLSDGNNHGAATDYVPVVSRRRAVDTSDLRSCALVQSRMKTWKHYPE